MANSDESRNQSVRLGGLERHGLGIAGLVGLSTLVSAWIGGVAVLDVVVLWPVASLALVAALAVGTVGAAAITIGYVVASVGIGTFDPTTGFVAGSLFLFGSVAAYLVRRELVLPVVGIRIASDAGRFPVVVAVASMAGGSAMAWGGEVTRQAPFFVGLRHAVSFLLVGVTIGLPLWAGVRWFRSRSGRDPDAASTGRRGRSRVVVAVAVAWLLIGTLGSIGYRGVGTILARFPYTFERRRLDGLLVLQDNTLFGAGGARVQAVLGGVMTSLLLWAVFGGATDDRDTGGGGGT